MGDFVTLPRDFGDNYLTNTLDIAWYNYRKHGMHDLPFSMSIYNYHSIHLVSRHPHAVKTAGYLAPLTYASWTSFIFSFSCIFFVLHINKVVNQFRGSQYLNLLHAILLFAFLTSYNQDLRSSTIEPLYEILPKHIDEVNPRNQPVLPVGSIPFLNNVAMWDFTYEFRATEHCLWCRIISYFRSMGRHSNRFALLSKQTYLTDVLKLYQFVHTGRMSSHDKFKELNFWEWKMSPIVSRYVYYGVIFDKHQAWSRNVNLEMLRIMVRKCSNP